MSFQRRHDAFGVGDRSGPDEAAARAPRRTRAPPRTVVWIRRPPRPAGAESEPDSGRAFRCRRPELRLQRGAPAAAHDEEMIHVTGVALGRDVHGTAGERRPVRGGERPAPRRPPGEARQARAQDRGLHLVEPRVDAELFVTVAIDLAAVAQAPDAIGERRSLVIDRAAVAERAEILRRVEAERARHADGADGPARRPSRGAPGSSLRRARGRGGVARRSRAAMSAGCPYRCTGRIARVRGVIAAGDLLRIDREPRPGRCRRTPGAPRPS